MISHFCLADRFGEFIGGALIGLSWAQQLIRWGGVPLGHLQQLQQNMYPCFFLPRPFRPLPPDIFSTRCDKTSLNCDETICPSIYVPNQMHHMLFQCILDLWGLLLFSCTIAQVIRPRKFPNHQFRPCLPAARKSGCQLVQLEQIYWFQRYPKSKCVLIFYYPIIAVDL